MNSDRREPQDLWHSCPVCGCACRKLDRHINKCHSRPQQRSLAVDASSISTSVHGEPLRLSLSEAKGGTEDLKRQIQQLKDKNEKLRVRYGPTSAKSPTVQVKQASRPISSAGRGTVDLKTKIYRLKPENQQARTKASPSSAKLRDVQVKSTSRPILSSGSGIVESRLEIHRLNAENEKLRGKIRIPDATVLSFQSEPVRGQRSEFEPGIDELREIVRLKAENESLRAILNVQHGRIRAEGRRFSIDLAGKKSVPSGTNKASLIVQSQDSPSHLSLECGCHGINENCRRCWGTGYVAKGDVGVDPLSTSTSRSTETAKTLTANVPGQSLFKTRSMLIDDPYREAISRSLPGRRRGRGKGPKGKKRGVAGSKAGIQKAIKPELKGASAGANKTKSGRRKANPPGPTLGSNTSAQTDQRKRDTHAINHSKEERRLDGSRDYWSFRETGRFGSQSKFDSMDDESKP